MKIRLQRISADQKSTLGELFIEGGGQCFTVEDEFRLKKIKGETRIPPGTYGIKLRLRGGFHTRYEKAFPDMHQGMLEVQDVPGFTDILIHCGNDEKDTAGCILVGSSHVYDPGRGYVLRSSRNAYRRIYPQIAKACLSGEKVTITVCDIPGEAAVDVPLKNKKAA